MGCDIHLHVETRNRKYDVDIKNTSPNTSKGRELKILLSACDGWEQTELEVEER